MMTTLDLPEELVFQAKSAALLRKTTLRHLVICGLEREIRNPTAPMPSPLRGLLDLNAAPWGNTSADEYVADLREGWE
ncbi:MAG: hypothetical protein WCS65_08875 [Verrucomicrobiae bacterium]